jgi:hypothetical protein
MSIKFGFPALSNRAINNNKALNNSKRNNKPLIIRVTDIILDENHPLISNGTYGLNSIGLIIGVGTQPYNISKQFSALPYNPNIKKIPTINEHIEIVQSTIPNSNGIQWFYKEPLGLFGSSTPNGNQFPSTTQNVSPPSQNVTYSQVELGAVNVISNIESELEVNSINNPSQATYVTKSDINPLLPFGGDIIHEGRYGNSLRFGSTSKSKSQYKNNWSEVGENGDPILILRNGQSINSPKEGWIPVTEDINNDLSSIYLTSYQKIPFKSKFLSEYTKPQIILNSSRIVINSSNDHLILNSSKDIYLTSTNQTNIESPKTYFDSKDIRLGSPNATEPVLKGNITNEILKELTNAISTLAQLLVVEKNWPSGALTVSNNPIASNVVNQLVNISTILNNNSLKSQTTKVF